MRGATVLILIYASIALLGCKDATQPFEAEDRAAPSAELPRRLTFSHGDDRAPAWSAGSDSVYYSAQYSDYTEKGFVLSALSRAGGVARRLLEAQRALTIEQRAIEPAPSPVTRELALLDLSQTLATSPCDADTIDCGNPAIELLESPWLREAWLSAVDSVEVPLWRRLHQIVFAGTPELFLVPNGGNYYRSRYLPWHIDWLERRALPMKPTWSPDGQQLAVVDSLGLHIVDPQTGAATLVAGGYIGNPAWSPDGEWIVFDRVEIVDSTVFVCTHSVEVNPGQFDVGCTEQRWFYETTPPVLERIRPDASERTTLGAGAEPAWHPDGARILYVDDERIVVRDLETGAVAALAGTEGGGEPAVSPDGRWLAFTRYDEATGGRDVWVTRLEQ